MKLVIMNLSIASADWSYYVGQQVELEDDLAKKWHSVGHCTIISQNRTTQAATNALAKGSDVNADNT